MGSGLFVFCLIGCAFFRGFDVFMDTGSAVSFIFFQEAGRAGRDGQKAFAVLLHAKSDRTLLKKRIADSFPDKDAIRQIYEHLNYFFQMPMGEGQGCVRAFNIDEFCRNFKHFPIQVDSALRILTRAG